jgi:V/A-type H+-transporting ATPase subunit I
MKKVSLVVRDRHADEALKQLREVGTMHIEMSGASSEKLEVIGERIARTESAIGIIKPFKAKEKKGAPPVNTGRRASDRVGSEEDEPYSAAAVNSPVRPDLVEFILGLAQERENLEAQCAVLAKEQGRIAAWGEFDPADIEILASGGVPVYLYELSPEAFAGIPEETRYIRLSGGTSVRIMVLDDKIPGLQPLLMPEKKLSVIEAELKDRQDRLAALNERIKGFGDRRAALDRIMGGAKSDFDFEKVRSGLEKVEGVPPSMGISCLSGFVPAGQLAQLKTAAAQNGWAIAADDPGPEDMPPTQLKNNAFTRLLTPLTGFLELLPGYHEKDVSAWFLLFVTVFFAMILGDAAYGFIFFLIAVLGMIKTAKNGVPVALKMLLLFSVTNIVWGAVTCTWFAVDYELLPQFLVDLSVPIFSMAQGTPETVVNQNLQVFCFSLALLHLSIARLGGFLDKLRKKDPRCIADLGSVGMLAGMYNLILMLVVSGDRFPMQQVSLYLLIGGFGLSFLFSYYRKNPLQAIVGSLQNIFPVILSVTGIFSDIMSYIRLWAVALAGTALAGAFNMMAGPLLGNFLIFFGILILIAGHGLNIALSTLSVLVHGVRLNILEFSGHAAITWSGIPYKPFALSANGVPGANAQGAKK